MSKLRVLNKIHPMFSHTWFSTFLPVPPPRVQSHLIFYLYDVCSLIFTKPHAVESRIPITKQATLPLEDHV